LQPQIKAVKFTDLLGILVIMSFTIKSLLNNFCVLLKKTTKQAFMKSKQKKIKFHTVLKNIYVLYIRF